MQSPFYSMSYLLPIQCNLFYRFNAMFFVFIQWHLFCKLNSIVFYSFNVMFFLFNAIFFINGIQTPFMLLMWLNNEAREEYFTTSFWWAVARHSRRMSLPFLSGEWFNKFLSFVSCMALGLLLWPDWETGREYLLVWVLLNLSTN